ncbi:MAG: type II toxin-antitoxin system ParD family antitoxin [Balneolales bacterium]|nr:type II toxin-antitoxin system ParD family antitoxin [Balneolales bacterium]
MTSSLGNYFDHFVQNQVSTGRYKNIKEAIQTGLQLLKNANTIQFSQQKKPGYFSATGLFYIIEYLVLKKIEGFGTESDSYLGSKTLSIRRSRSFR